MAASRRNEWGRMGGALEYTALLLLLLCCVGGSEGATYDNLIYQNQTIEAQLRDTLMADYDLRARPVLQSQDTVNCTVGLAFQNLIDVDQISGIMTMMVWLRLGWEDRYLTWNNATYDGISQIVSFQSDIWLPNVVLLNEAQKFLTGFFASDIYSYEGGGQYWSQPGTVKFLCAMTLRYFPFDVQECTMTFGSWDFSGWLQDLQIMSAQDLGIVHSEWDIVEIKISRSETFYSCCPSEPWPEISFTMVMKRRPGWYFVYLIFPTLIVTVIMMAGFFVNPLTGARVQLGITSLLTVITLLFISKDQLPISSESTIIGDFFMGTIVYNMISFVETTVTIYLAFQPRPGRILREGFLLRLLSIIRFEASSKMRAHVEARNEKRLQNIANGLTPGGKKPKNMPTKEPAPFEGGSDGPPINTENLHLEKKGGKVASTSHPNYKGEKEGTHAGMAGDKNKTQHGKLVRDGSKLIEHGTPISDDNAALSHKESQIFKDHPEWHYDPTDPDEPLRIVQVRESQMDKTRLMRVAESIDVFFRLFIPVSFMLFTVMLFGVGDEEQSWNKV